MSGLFGLFNIVTFKQDSCTPSANNDRTGTCMTRSECENLSGEGATIDGQCAAGQSHSYTQNGL